MENPGPMLATCFDCGKRYSVFKNDRLCPECEQLEWGRRPVIYVRRATHRICNHTDRRAPHPDALPSLPSLAMRLHGKRATAHG